MKPPTHILNIAWGSEVKLALEAFGIVQKNWQTWEGDESLIVSSVQSNDVKAFGTSAVVRVFAVNELLEGVQFIFRNCKSQWMRVQDEVRAMYKLESTLGDDIYETWSTGELIRLIHDRHDDTCELVIAGPRFGPVYSRYLLVKGLTSLAGKLRP